MRNAASDISNILNLILPEENQLPYGDAFDLRFADDPGGLKPYFRGLVSYKGTTSENLSFVGEIPPGFEGMKLYLTRASKRVSREYWRYLTSRGRNRGISLTDARVLKQITAFVFPDGSYGKEGWEKISQNPKALERFRVYVKIPEGLRRCSSKFYEVVRCVMENPTEKVFIYSDLVTGGGCILLARILEIYGFSTASGRETTTGRRYGLLVGSPTEGGNIAQISLLFNHPKNVLGEYIQVLIGSGVVSEGYTFGDVSHTHVISSQWNYVTLEQVVARTHRLFSHQNLREAKRDFQSKIYLHATLLHRRFEYLNDTASNIDLHMHQMAERKNIAIGKIVNELKASSFVESPGRLQEDTYLRFYAPIEEIRLKIISFVSERFHAGQRRFSLQDCWWSIGDFTLNEITRAFYRIKPFKLTGKTWVYRRWEFLLVRES